MSSLSRRRLLGMGAAGLGVAAAAAVGVETGILPGRSRLYGELGLNGPAGTAPEVESTLVSGAFRSAERLAEVRWSIAYPAGAAEGDELPVVVALHGRYENHRHLFGDHIGLDRFLTASRLRFAIAAADGGDTYWHPRASGEDAAAMVTNEFLPLLADRGLRTDRLGLYGYSMGGYGALRLAGLLGPRRVAAAVAVSPALWTSYDATADGAFDDADDFRAHDVLGRQASLNGVPVRVDCGRGDSFRGAVEDYREGFPAGEAPFGGFQPGGHDVGYWRRVAPAELTFLGQHLVA